MREERRAHLDALLGRLGRRRVPVTLPPQTVLAVLAVLAACRTFLCRLAQHVFLLERLVVVLLLGRASLTSGSCGGLGLGLDTFETSALREGAGSGPHSLNERGRESATHVRVGEEPARPRGLGDDALGRARREEIPDVLEDLFLTVDLLAHLVPVAEQDALRAELGECRLLVLGEVSLVAVLSTGGRYGVLIVAHVDVAGAVVVDVAIALVVVDVAVLWDRILVRPTEREDDRAVLALEVEQLLLSIYLLISIGAPTCKDVSLDATCEGRRPSSSARARAKKEGRRCDALA